MKNAPKQALFRVFCAVGGEVGGGSPRHERRAQTGMSFMCFVLWEVR